MIISPLGSFRLSIQTILTNYTVLKGIYSVIIIVQFQLRNNGHIFREIRTVVF